MNKSKRISTTLASSVLLAQMASGFSRYTPEYAEILFDLNDVVLGRHHVPIKGTVNILQDLRLHGYTLRIASNISEYNFERCKERYTDVFGLFDGAKLAAVVDGKKISKPSKQFFVDYFNTFGNKNKLTIFVDDKKINIQTFEAVGKELGFPVRGIQFKHFKQLRAVFEKLNIFVLPEELENKKAITLDTHNQEM